MSRIDEPTSPAFVVQVAHMTVDSHNAGHPCQCCTDDGCRQLDWAGQTIAEHRAARAKTTPRHRPDVRDGRRSKENDMTKWTTPNRCDNSGPNCVEVGTDLEFPGVRFVRSTQDRTEVVRFDADEWAAFEESIRGGQKF